MNDQLNIRIARIICKIGDPLLKHIRERCPDDSPEAVDAVVQTMVWCGAVRQKEDPYEHAWAYVLTRQGREMYADVLEGTK